MTQFNPSSTLPFFIKSSDTYKSWLQSLASEADIQFNGSHPWDMQIHDTRTYQRIMSSGSIGGGEAYMDGWWDCEQLDEFFTRIMRSGIDSAISRRGGARLILAARMQNLQTPKRSLDVAHKHYDLSPELYRSMLDHRMIYSCGYWANANDLAAAQEAKLDLICRKLGLEPGMHLLDIGCGWGGAAKFAAERYGVKVTGITVSVEQGKLAVDTCKGLPVDIIVDDYRALTGQYDRIMSIGMFEHVGFKNYREYFQIARNCLKSDGLFLLHTIGCNTGVKIADPWVVKYIFPNSMLPSAAQISQAFESLFVLEDWHNFGTDYDKTLMSWYANFHRNWPQMASQFDQRFYRMWTYYLLMCAGSFRARACNLWQLVLSPDGVPGGWTSVR